MAVHTLAVPLKIPYLGAENSFQSWCCVTIAGEIRTKVESAVAAHPGSHLIFVAYHHTEFKAVEWVYNGADIDGSRVVWARDMGPDANRELMK